MKTVARELKQKGFDSREHEVLLALEVAASRLIEPWARFLKSAADLTPNQYNVLRILRGSHPTKLACGDIGERMIDRSPDVTRLVDRLRRRGLVRRINSRRDRRVVEVGITEQGLALLAELDSPSERMPKALLGHLEAERLSRLGELLDAVISDMGTFP